MSLEPFWHSTVDMRVGILILLWIYLFNDKRNDHQKVKQFYNWLREVTSNNSTTSSTVGMIVEKQVKT